MAGITKVTAQTESYTVIDDLLPPDARDRLWNYFQIQPLNPVRALGLQGHWLLDDSDTLRGPTVGWGHKFDAQYPCGAPIDDVMKALVDCAALFAASVGQYNTDWKIFSAMPTVYQAGQGLVWHRDSEDNTGSWIYYAHNDWNIEWGGELLLSAARDLPRDSGVYFHRLRATPDLPAPPPWQSHLYNSDANELLMTTGLGGADGFTGGAVDEGMNSSDRRSHPQHYIRHLSETHHHHVGKIKQPRRGLILFWSLGTNKQVSPKSTKLDLGISNYRSIVKKHESGSVVIRTLFENNRNQPRVIFR